MSEASPVSQRRGFSPYRPDVLPRRLYGEDTCAPHGIDAFGITNAKRGDKRSTGPVSEDGRIAPQRDGA